MRLSLSVTNCSWPSDFRAELARLGERAEGAGLDTMWVPDHLLQVDPTTPAEDKDALEAYTGLGFVAARTDRIRLGSLVTNVSMRPPALLVKAVTTLDALAPGRAWLGLGAGYQEDESRAMGIPLPDTSERFERLEDTIRLALQMWAGDDSPFESAHYSLARPESIPRPHRRPAILIGGMGEKKTLRLVAQYADACNLFDIPDDGATITRKLEVLAEHCTQLRRPFDQIDKTLSTRLGADETPDQLAARCRRLADRGIGHLIFVSSRPWSAVDVATLGHAIPLIRELQPAGIG